MFRLPHQKGGFTTQWVTPQWICPSYLSRSLNSTKTFQFKWVIIWPKLTVQHLVGHIPIEWCPSLTLWLSDHAPGTVCEDAIRPLPGVHVYMSQQLLSWHGLRVHCVLLHLQKKRRRKKLESARLSRRSFLT